MLQYVRQMSEPIVRGLILDPAAVLSLFRDQYRIVCVPSCRLDPAQKNYIEQDPKHFFHVRTR